MISAPSPAKAAVKLPSPLMAVVEVNFTGVQASPQLAVDPELVAVGVHASRLASGVEGLAGSTLSGSSASNNGRRGLALLVLSHCVAAQTACDTFLEIL